MILLPLSTLAHPCAWPLLPGTGLIFFTIFLRAYSKNVRMCACMCVWACMYTGYVTGPGLVPGSTSCRRAVPSGCAVWLCWLAVLAGTSACAVPYTQSQPDCASGWLALLFCCAGWLYFAVPSVLAGLTATRSL